MGCIRYAAIANSDANHISFGFVILIINSLFKVILNTCHKVISNPHHLLQQQHQYLPGPHQA